MAATPPTSVDYPAENSIDRRGQPILLIVAHDTEGVDSRGTLQHGDGRGVSIHKLIQKFPRANGTTDIYPGKPERQTSGALIYDMVPDSRGANHAGYSTWTHNGVTYGPNQQYSVNHISLGFELECLGSKKPSDKYTEEQLLCAGYLIMRWREKYGPLTLVRHAEIDPTRRKDTFNLTVAELERWANAAAVVYGPATTRYVVRGLPVYQAQSLAGVVAGYLASGTPVEIDKTYPNGAGHMVNPPLGFVDMDGLGTV